MSPVIDRIRQRYSTWRARGRSREGFSQLVCRAFDDVAGSITVSTAAPGTIAYLDAGFSLRTTALTRTDFQELNQAVSGLGLLGPGSPLDGQDEDDVWYYALTLVAEKTLAWLAQVHPARPEWLLALGLVKERLHKQDEASGLYREARKSWETGAKRKRAAMSSSRSRAAAV